MKLSFVPYVDQVWPSTGQHVLAQFDAETIIVYQAYNASIARYAVENQQFGGGFSFSRMSWIKPNFLWMMFRSGWASKEGQTHILAIRLHRTFFDEVLKQAVASTFSEQDWPTHEAWRAALQSSEVRLQWDPDHDPEGRPIQRRAVQLGLRGEMLRRFAAPIEIEDITAMVHEQREHASASFTKLMTPLERIYQPLPSLAQNPQFHS